MAINPPRANEQPAFKGLITNADPHDIGPAAAVIQDNLQCKSAGQLQCRKGVRPGGFANAEPPSDAAVISAAYYQRPEADWIVYHLADGSIKTGRSFS